MAHIDTISGEAYTERGIAAKLHCSTRAVDNAIFKVSADGTFHDMNRSGRQRKATAMEHRPMRQMVMCSPKSFC